jgi:2-polyprenyl-3-methyl-5-hydroxy-6-metoxy-1,4-benzoquinol methylase
MLAFMVMKNESIIKTIKRTNCCICGSIDLVKRLKIDNFPVYMGTTNSDSSLDLFKDQTWIKCEKCGCLQLLELLPLSLIYQSNHSTEVVGKLWRDHHNAFAEFIARHKPTKILEIGAAHGYLANTLTEKLPAAEYTVIEPDSSLVNSRIKIIKGFVEEHIEEVGDKDCIIHSHVLEHIYEPVEFINQIATHTDMNCEMYISFPNFRGLIESGTLNSLNFEHTYLLDPTHADLIFKNCGFSILESVTYLSHSYFYRLKKTSVINANKEYFPDISRQSDKFIEMIDDLSNFVTSVNSKIKNHKGPVYLFGAHVFSQALLALGLETSKVVGILDNALDKQNKRLYGTKYTVFSPSVIENQSNALVVLKASHYQDEIKAQLKQIDKTLVVLEN